MEDPIAVSIKDLEQDKNGNPKEIDLLLKDMTEGKQGKIRIVNANRLLPKVINYFTKITRKTFLICSNVLTEKYSTGNLLLCKPNRLWLFIRLQFIRHWWGTNFWKKFSKTASWKEISLKSFREIIEPSDLSKYTKSYFNLLIEYNSTKARKELPGEFETLQVKTNETKYPGLRVSYPFSSIFFAPNVYCDPNSYFYDDDLASKTIDAHKYINSHIMKKSFVDLGCDANSKYKKGTRAYVLISQPIESYWNTRPPESVKEVKWTFVGMRSGVFRNFIFF